MENSDKEIEKPDNSTENQKKIIALTPEMEIGADENRPIYDLVEELDEKNDSEAPYNDKNDMRASSETPNPIFPLLSEPIIQGEVTESPFEKMLTPKIGQKISTSDRGTEAFFAKADRSSGIQSIDVDSESENPSSDLEDEFINLDDIAAEPDVGLESVKTTGDAPTVDDNEESIINLEDVVASPEDEVVPEEATADLSITNKDTNDVIDLIDIVPHSQGAMEEHGEAALRQDVNQDEDDIIDLVHNVDKMPRLYGEISDEVIENYIRTKYHGDIELLIAKVVEKTVQKEINAIRHNYMEDSD